MSERIFYHYHISTKKQLSISVCKLPLVDLPPLINSTKSNHIYSYCRSFQYCACSSTLCALPNPHTSILFIFSFSVAVPARRPYPYVTSFPLFMVLLSKSSSIHSLNVYLSPFPPKPNPFLLFEISNATLFM